jgi:hypothetical protein
MRVVFWSESGHSSKKSASVSSPLGVVQAVRNNSAPPKWSKLWTDAPKPGDRIGAYTPEQLEQMNQEFTAAVERAFRSGGESFFAASRTYDVRRPRSRRASGGSEHF